MFCDGLRYAVTARDYFFATLEVAYKIAPAASQAPSLDSALHVACAQVGLPRNRRGRRNWVVNILSNKGRLRGSIER